MYTVLPDTEVERLCDQTFTTVKEDHYPVTDEQHEMLRSHKSLDPVQSLAATKNSLKCITFKAGVTRPCGQKESEGIN